MAGPKSADLYRSDKEATRALSKRLFFDAATLDGRGSLDRARRLRSAADLVRKAAAVLEGIEK